MTLLYFDFPKTAKIGDEMTCSIEWYEKEGDREFVVLRDPKINGVIHTGSYKYYITWTNGDLIQKIYKNQSGSIELIGKPARLVFHEYETEGYNGRRYTNKSFLFQPVEGEIRQGREWRIIR